MQENSAPKHNPKVNKLSFKSKELTGKDWPEILLFYSREFENKLLKKINIQDIKKSRVVIPAKHVGTFLQYMTCCYKNLCKTYPHLNYPMFSDWIYHDFALCQKKHPDRFLSRTTVLTYFKMEMTFVSLQ